MSVALTAGKKIKGRKRHIIADVMGNLLAVVVHAANIHDTKSGINPAKRVFENLYSTCGRSEKQGMDMGDFNHDLGGIRRHFVVL